jgi:hypothetical protein
MKHTIKSVLEDLYEWFEVSSVIVRGSKNR